MSLPPSGSKSKSSRKSAIRRRQAVWITRRNLGRIQASAAIFNWTFWNSFLSCVSVGRFISVQALGWLQTKGVSYFGSWEVSSVPRTKILWKPVRRSVAATSPTGLFNGLSKRNHTGDFYIYSVTPQSKIFLSWGLPCIIYKLVYLFVYLFINIPDEVIGFFNWPNPSSRTMALGSTQPLTKMSTRNLPRGKGRPARGADFTTICEPIV
jgi:hypothetical protein